MLTSFALHARTAVPPFGTRIARLLPITHFGNVRYRAACRLIASFRSQKHGLLYTTHAMATLKFSQRLYSTNEHTTSASTSLVKATPKVPVVPKQLFHVDLVLREKDKQRSVKHQMLAQSGSLWQRFKLRAKWVMIRNNRPFSIDEVGTMFSWLVISQVVWLILGTTTFLSLLLFTLNTVFAKGLVGETIGRILNRFVMNEYNIRFQDAIVPEWRKKCIKFNNVEIISKDPNGINGEVIVDLKIYQVEVSLSVTNWLSGHGIVQDISIFGMTGDVKVDLPNANRAEKKPLIESLIGILPSERYHLGNVEISDSSLNLSRNDETNNDSPIIFRIAIYSTQIPRLRFEHLLTDLFGAKVLTGSINHSLFNIHKRQLRLPYVNDLQEDLSVWKSIIRLSLNPTNLKDLGLDRTSTFNWMEDGTVQIIADFMLPHEEGVHDDKTEFITKIAPFTKKGSGDEGTRKGDTKYIVLDLKLKFTELKTKYPVKSPELTSKEPIVSLEELYPVLSYLNSRPNHFSLIKNHSNLSYFDGDSGRHDVSDVERTRWGLPTILVKRRETIPTANNSRTTSISSFMQSQESNGEGFKPSKKILKFQGGINDEGDEGIVLRARIVEDVQTFEKLDYSRLSKTYDKLSLELYMDLIKLVEEWEFRNKKDWVKQWGATLASQLLIFGLGAVA